MDGVQAHLILQVASPSEDYLAGNSGLVSVAPAFRRASACGKIQNFVIPRRAARRGISLFLRLNPREIPHFVRNDKINCFFRGLICVIAKCHRQIKAQPRFCWQLERAIIRAMTRARKRSASKPSRRSRRNESGARFQNFTDSLAEIGRSFYQRGWVFGTSGNFSAVVSERPLRLAITPTGLDKGALAPEQFLEIDETARVVRGSGQPSAETGLHLAIVRARGAGAVLHTHSLWSTLLSDSSAADGAVPLEGLRDAQRACAASPRTSTGKFFRSWRIARTSLGWRSRSTRLLESRPGRSRLPASPAWALHLGTGPGRSPAPCGSP